jgi:hypothetical protein
VTGTKQYHKSLDRINTIQIAAEEAQLPNLKVEKSKFGLLPASLLKVLI